VRIVRAGRVRRERNERAHHLTNVAAQAARADLAETRFTKVWRAVGWMGKAAARRDLFVDSRLKYECTSVVAELRGRCRGVSG
jgi:hypothetical protein